MIRLSQTYSLFAHCHRMSMSLLYPLLFQHQMSCKISNVKETLKLKIINLHGCKSNITEPVLILDTVREFLIIDHLPIAPVVVKRLDGATLRHVVSETARGSQQIRISTWQLDNLTVDNINFLFILFNLHHIPLLSTWPCLQQTQCWRWSLHRQ